MSSVELGHGVRRYTLLTPIVLQVDGERREWRAVHMLPITRRIERAWQDGEIDGPHGMLEALIDRLTYEPYFVIEEMQHPDVEFFNREFYAHLPRSISEPLARLEMPARRVPDPTPAPPDDEGGPYAGDWGEPAPDVPPAPRRPPPPIPRDRQPQYAPEPAAASPHAHMDGANYELAELGPDESLGTPEQLRAAEEARARARGDGKDLARELIDEPSEPKSPLAAAVARSSEPPAWQPTPRDPFDKSRPPPKRPAIRPPTRVSAEPDALPIDQALPGTPQQVTPRAPIVDPKTRREAVFQPKGDYVPDMSTVGYEQPPTRPTNGFGIGDLEP